MIQPLISIIITVLNGDKTLSQCLFSIADQTFTNYELVLVDGGSTDNTLNIVYASSICNKKISVLPGLGLYAGLNTGISLSTGKWLYFIGADDEFYNRDTLQKVSEVIEKLEKDVKVIVGSVECVKQQDILRPLFGSPYLFRHHVHHQGMFYERSVFNNILYNENMRIASDYELNLQLALSGVAHRAMNLIICKFGGDGVSENQLRQGYVEMQQSHRRLFKGVSQLWILNYFWLRRRTGAFLRQNNFFKFRTTLKRVFG